MNKTIYSWKRKGFILKYEHILHKNIHNYEKN